VAEQGLTSDAQTPAEQTPVPLHQFPGVHFILSGAEQVLFCSEHVLLHGVPIAQVDPVPTQVPFPLHVSVNVQNFPSSHDVPAAAKQFFVVSLHDEKHTVDELEDGHGFPECIQIPEELHVSTPLQYMPSSHVVPEGTIKCLHPDSAHTSMVQGFPSSQLFGH